MPEPAETIDVGTDYGIVRVYRFDGAGTVNLPLLLLPGRASGVPVWADNLPSLLQIGDVYAIDLLGEPGMSIQSRPITSDADQAAWLHQTMVVLPEDAFHVIGLSIGGWTAVNLALHQPYHVATLTLIEPALAGQLQLLHGGRRPGQECPGGANDRGGHAALPAAAAATDPDFRGASRVT